MRLTNACYFPSSSYLCCPTPHSAPSPTYQCICIYQDRRALPFPILSNIFPSMSSHACLPACLQHACHCLCLLFSPCMAGLPLLPPTITSSPVHDLSLPTCLPPVVLSLSLSHLCLSLPSLYLTTPNSLYLSTYYHDGGGKMGQGGVFDKTKQTGNKRTDRRTLFEGNKTFCMGMRAHLVRTPPV